MEEFNFKAAQIDFVVNLIYKVKVARIKKRHAEQTSLVQEDSCLILYALGCLLNFTPIPLGVFLTTSPLTLIDFGLFGSGIIARIS